MTNLAPTLVAITRLMISDEHVPAANLIGEFNDEDLHRYALQVSIHYAEAIKALCDAYGADVDVVLAGMGLRAAEVT